MKNTLNVSRSLKEQKIRRYTTIVFALAALATLISIVTFVYFSNQSMIADFFIEVLSTGIPVTNIALVTYLLGNIKKELDRLSWIIIGIAILGGILGAIGEPVIVWLPLLMIFLAGLLNFVEVDE